MRKFILLIGFLGVFATICYAQAPFKFQTQSLTEALPESVGMSAERLARLDNVLQTYIQQQWIPGAVAIVARKGKIVYHKSFGKNGNQPTQTTDLFRIASMTKPITSVALLMLYEEGKFSLDDAVSKYLPEFKNPQVLTAFNEKDTTYTAEPSKTEITVRQILTHTSGITYGFIDPKKWGAIYAKAKVPDLASDQKITLQEKMKILTKLPLMHQPGEKWSYGLNTDVCGYLVEVLSGISLSDFCEKRIFVPLGMADTHYFFPESAESRLAKVYFSNKDKEGKVEPYTNQPEANMVRYPTQGARTYFSGGSGLSSTALDYLKFCQMILNGGEYNGKRILSRKTIELMAMNQIGDLNIGWSGGKFGLGFAITGEKQLHKRLGSLGRLGWGGIFSTTFWIDPVEDVSAVLMLQIYPFSHGEINEKFENVVYQAIVD